MDKRQKGNLGEDLAVDYLLKKGYRILVRNFRFDRGEIDIIAEDGATLVFVEVKARGSNSYGEPEEAITVRKREQLQKVAEGYLFNNGIEDRECRFDVIAVRWEGTVTTVDHLIDAL